jgi:4-hydroxy-tetrahydrodipicolinate synthase
MVTPLRDRDTLDEAGLERLLEHILAGGVHGLFILGTTGEAPSLSYRLRQELIERTCRQVNGRLPVLVGITDTAFVESVRIAGMAAEAGAAAVVLAPPYYFAASQKELLEYLGHLVPQLPLPLFLYNAPTHTKVVYEVETVRRAAELPAIVGLKDSSANMIYFQRLLTQFRDRSDFTLLVGPEELLGECTLLGGCGGVSGGANLYPQLYVQLYEAARSRDLDRLAVLQQQIMRISNSIYCLGSSGSSYLRGLKCALSILGICDDFLAEPFQRFEPPERALVAQALRGVGLLDGPEAQPCRSKP